MQRIFPDCPTTGLRARGSTEGIAPWTNPREPARLFIVGSQGKGVLKLWKTISSAECLWLKKKKSCKESSQTGIFLGSHLKSSSHNPPTGLCILSLHLVQPPPFFLQRCAVGVRCATRAFSPLGGKGLSVHCRMRSHGKGSSGHGGILCPCSPSAPLSHWEVRFQ